MPFSDPPMPSQFDVGDPNAGHSHFDASGMKLYGPDGVTVVFEFDTISGAITRRPVSGGQPTVELFDTQDPAQVFLGFTRISVAGVGVKKQAIMSTAAPNMGGTNADIVLTSGSSDATQKSHATIDADTIDLGNVTGSAVVTANGDILPGSLVAAPVPYSSAAFSADTLLATVGPVPVVAGKRYEMFANAFDLSGGTAGDRFTFRFQANGADFANNSQTIPIGGTFTAPPLFSTVWTATLTGNISFTFRGVRAAGVSTIVANSGLFWVKNAA